MVIHIYIYICIYMHIYHILSVDSPRSDEASTVLFGVNAVVFVICIRFGFGRLSMCNMSFNWTYMISLDEQLT